MTYHNQPEHDYEAQASIEALISALSHASANNEVVHLPTVKALKELKSEMETLRKGTIDQSKTIDQLRLEVKYLQQRDSEQNARLDKYLNRPTITGFAILLGAVILIPSALFYTFIPSKADRDISNINEKSDFLYHQELERYKKKKK
jgi:hypothetical protein